MALRDRVERTCRRRLDERELRIALLRELRADVPFDAYAWLLTDPETCVGSTPLAEIPSLADLPALIRAKYLTPTNRWTGLPSVTAVTLAGAERDGEHEPWQEALRGYGIDDVLSVVFRDAYGCWGFLDCWRSGGSFSPHECGLLDGAAATITSALRRSLAGAFEHGARTTDDVGGPAVLLLSDGIELMTQTPHTDAYLRALLPPDADRTPVPAGAYNVAAQLLAREAGVDAHPAWARVHVRDGTWVTLRAARIEQPVPGGASIAVSIESTPPAQRASLFARVSGLSERETALLTDLVAGHDTRALAARLHLSEHTVQDHLKSIFAKTGVNNRRLLTARATGVA